MRIPTQSTCCRHQGVPAVAWLLCVLTMTAPTVLRADVGAIKPELLAEFTLRIARYTEWPTDRQSYHIHAVGLNAAQKSAFARLAQRELRGKPVEVTFGRYRHEAGTMTPDIVILSDRAGQDAQRWCFPGQPVLTLELCANNPLPASSCDCRIIRILSDGRINLMPT